MKNLLNSFAFFFMIISAVNGQSFWSENFEGGMPGNWKNEDLSGQSVDWRHETNTDILTGLGIFKSASAENGFMIARGKRVSSPHQSTLTTSVIDCSGKTEVFLSFENFAVTNSVSAAIGLRVLVKNESEDWESYVVMPEQNKDGERQISPNPYRSFIDISAKAAGFSKVQIRWEWKGILEEFWAMDDVELFDRQPYYERVIWGQNPGEGDFDGGTNGWYENTISAPKPSEHKWQWDSIGYVGDALVYTTELLKPFRDFPYLDSYSNNNGAMVFNADFYSTGDSIIPTIYPKYHAELISPIINLSNATGEVNVRFEQMFMIVGSESNNFPSSTSFSFTTDGGRTWEEPIGLNQNIPNNSLVTNTETISLCGAIGHSNVRLKFIFDGNLYFWAIDDVVIIEKSDNDLRVRDDFYAIPPNAMTPASQVENIGFLADIENFGQNTQSNVRVFAEVIEKNSKISVFKDSLSFGEMDNCTVIENIQFENDFLPMASRRDYEIHYFVTSDSTDDLTDNDTIRVPFQISDSTYSKETGPTVQIAPIKGTNFEYGNVFFIPHGKNKVATSVTFGIHRTDKLQGADVNIWLYRSYADQNGDSYFDENESIIVGFGNYTFNGDEERLTGGIITAPLTDVSGNPLYLEDNAYYLATVQYINDDNRACRMLASEEYDYWAMWSRYDSIGSNRYASIEKVEGNKFDVASLGFDLIPVVRLNVNKFPTPVFNLKNQSLVEIYPNPTPDFFTVKNEIRGIKFIEMLDAKGTLINRWNFQKGRHYDISKATSGTYFLKFRTEKGWFGKKLVKREH